MVIVEFNVVPLGKGTSVSKFVRHAVETLRRKYPRLALHHSAMCTVFEVPSIRKAFEVVTTAHEAVFELRAARVVTTVKVDDRRDKQATVSSKLAAIGVSQES